MKFNCIFFDFDGVIVENSQELAFSVVSEVVETHGIVMERDYFYQRYTGMRATQILKLIAVDFFIEFPSNTLEQMRELYKIKYFHQAQLGTNLIELLTKVPEKYICSSSDLDYINKYLHLLKIKHFFPDSEIFSPVCENDLKPSPAVYLQGINNAKTPITECCAVEDSVVGVQAAKAAGLYTVGYVPNKNQFQIELLKKAGADEIIHDFLELV